MIKLKLNNKKVIDVIGDIEMYLSERNDNEKSFTYQSNIPNVAVNAMSVSRR